MNRHKLANLWLKVTGQKMNIIPGGYRSDYEHKGELCGVEGHAIAEGGYLFVFERSGRETLRVRLSYEAVDSMSLMLDRLPRS